VFPEALALQVVRVVLGWSAIAPGWAPLSPDVSCTDRIAVENGSDHLNEKSPDSLTAAVADPAWIMNWVPAGGRVPGRVFAIQFGRPGTILVSLCASSVVDILSSAADTFTSVADMSATVVEMSAGSDPV